MQTSEQLSAFLDGELTVDAHIALSQAVLRDPEQQGILGRYQQVRQVLQRQDQAPDAIQVASHIQAALADEPALLAPQTNRKSAITTRRRWPVALAATLVLAAVIGIAPQVTPLLLNTTTTLAQQTTTPSPALVQRPPAYVNRYLSEHHAYAGASHVTQPLVQTYRVAYHHAE